MRQLIVFKVGVEEFAIDILLSKEIVVMGNITPVPETEDYVEGVMNLRGNLVPVIDLKKRLRASNAGSERHNRIIIARLEGKLIGLMVDDASEVLKVSDEAVEPPPDVITELGIDYIAGIVNINGRYITLLELNKALTAEILSDLDEVMSLLDRQYDSVAQIHLA
jgi:purine-binding chemotaxis protein CheW